jgi:exosortase
LGTIDLTQEPVAGISENEIKIRDLKLPAYVPLAICLAVIGWFYMPTFKWWYGIWMAKESYYSHGILVPLISLFVLWLKKKDLRETIIRAYLPGYLFLVPVILVTVLAVWGDADSVTGLSFPLILFGIILTLFGPSMARKLAFPIGYLYFMCVLPGFVLTIASFKIQMLSTIGATSLLRLLGFDAYSQGAMIILPNVEVMVGAPCSGFRLLISLLAFVVLFVYLKEGPLWGRASLLAFTVPLSLIVNSIRITLIALVGDYMGSDAMHKFHDYSGYLILVLAFVVLTLMARLVKCQKFNSMLGSS